MLGLPLHYLLKHPMEGIAILASDPLEVWTRVQESYVAQREERGPHCQYESDENWERRLHEQLGVPWPCKLTQEFWKLWSEVMNELEAKGICAGPQSFGSWNDGDAGFVRTIWCLTHHLRPKDVIETGVAHGVTSRFVLEALERNKAGHLWSIDLPPIERSWQSHIGVAVGDRYAARWSYIKGSSRLRLPKLLCQLPQIDLFIHDSMHTERNVRFELDRAWTRVRPGGALVVDDVDANWGFRSFTQSFSSQQSMICEAEPIRPDPRRFNKKGLFGIILKKTTEPV
ncbi:MAG: class I SAM-dependent methyltransferase [Candidatus Acidiferrum sp.]